jgi:[ribosomal protein S5]-alanine N-acetyltransferase
MPDLVAPALDPVAFFDGRQPTLSGDGLTLRPWREQDWPTLVLAYTDPEIQRWHCRTLSEREARAWAAIRAHQWRDRSAVDWAITDEAGRVLGRLGIRRFELAKGLGEVAYWVLPEGRGRRLTSRALDVLCDWAFGHQGMHRLELEHSVANQPSCRVAERAGFLLEGVKRSELEHTDGWHDMHLHARIAGDDPPAARLLSGR